MVFMIGLVYIYIGLTYVQGDSSHGPIYTPRAFRRSDVQHSAVQQSSSLYQSGQHGTSSVYRSRGQGTPLNPHQAVRHKRVQVGSPVGPQRTHGNRIQYLSPHFQISLPNRQRIWQGQVGAVGSGLTFGYRQPFSIDTNADLIFGVAVCDQNGEVYDSVNTNQLLGGLIDHVPTRQQIFNFVNGNGKYSHLGDKTSMSYSIYDLAKRLQFQGRCIVGCGAMYETGDAFVLDCAGNLIMGKAIVEHHRGLLLVRDSVTRRAVGYLTRIAQVALKSPLLRTVISHIGSLRPRVNDIQGLSYGFITYQTPQNVLSGNGFLADDYCPLAIKTGYNMPCNDVTSHVQSNRIQSNGISWLHNQYQQPVNSDLQNIQNILNND